MSYGLHLSFPSEHPLSNPVAALPSSAAFATVQDDFLLSLTPRERSRALIDTPTYAAIRAVLLDFDLASSSKFCAWARKTFCLDEAGENILHEGKRVARTDHFYDILCVAHVNCAHGSPDVTLKEVRMHWRFVPKGLVDRFVKACPTCTMPNTFQRQAEHTSLQRPPVPVSVPVSGSVPVPVPRVLIFPASEVSPPADHCPLGRSPNMPLGTSTTELLTGFTRSPVMRAQFARDCEPSSSRLLGLRLRSPVHYPGAESSLKPCIDPVPSPSPFSAPPPPPYNASTQPAPSNVPSIIIDTTFLPRADPPPRPPRSPFRPLPNPISRTALPMNCASPLRPIDVRAENAFRPLFCETDIEVENMGTPAPAYTSKTPSKLPSPSTPSSEWTEDAEVRHYASCVEGESTAYGDEYAAIRGKRILTGMKPCTTEVTKFTSAHVKDGSDSPRSPHSIASLWSQDSVREEEYYGDVEGERDQDFL